MTLFLRQITKSFGTTFVNIHHLFAITGIGLIILHGLTYISVYFSFDLSSFLNQPVELWSSLSFVADILIIIAVIAALWRKKFISKWRGVHAFMYVAFFLIVVHAILIGTDVQAPMIFGTYVGMLVVVIIAFILKRYQISKLTKHAPKN